MLKTAENRTKSLTSSFKSWMGNPEQTHPYMSGQPLPAKTLGELGASNDLNLTLQNMTLNDLILKEFGKAMGSTFERT